MIQSNVNSPRPCYNKPRWHLPTETSLISLRIQVLLVIKLYLWYELYWLCCFLWDVTSIAWRLSGSSTNTLPTAFVASKISCDENFFRTICAVQVCSARLCWNAETFQVTRCYPPYLWLDLVTWLVSSRMWKILINAGFIFPNASHL